MNIKEWYARAVKEDYWCVGKGWKALLTDLCGGIIAIDSTIEVIQVKEKYGGLRFYIGGVETEKFDEIHNLIDTAETKSYTVCEECGRKGGRRSINGWILTLCDECDGRGR